MINIGGKFDLIEISRDPTSLHGTVPTPVRTRIFKLYKQQSTLKKKKKTYTKLSCVK